MRTSSFKDSSAIAYQTLFHLFVKHEERRLNQVVGVAKIAHYVFDGHDYFINKSEMLSQMAFDYKLPKVSGYDFKEAREAILSNGQTRGENGIRNLYYNYKDFTFAHFSKCNPNARFRGSGNQKCTCNETGPKCMHYFTYFAGCLRIGCVIDGVNNHRELILEVDELIADLTERDLTDPALYGGLIQELLGEGTIQDIEANPLGTAGPNEYEEEWYLDEEAEAEHTSSFVNLSQMIKEFNRARSTWGAYWDAYDIKDAEQLRKYNRYIYIGKMAEFIFATRIPDVTLNDLFDYPIRTYCIIQDTVDSSVYLLMKQEMLTDAPTTMYKTYSQMSDAVAEIMAFINSGHCLFGPPGNTVISPDDGFYELDSRTSVDQKLSYLLG